MEVPICCPACHADLLSSHERLTCTGCGKVYPVSNEIPILINEEKSVFSIADYTTSNSVATKIPTGLKAAIIRGIWFVQRHSPDITLNVTARKNYAQLAGLLFEKNPNPKVLIIGGRTLGMGMEDLVKLPITFMETDIAFGPKTKIICDAHSLPFKDETFDAVIIQAVMEYLADPYQCAAEIHRVLKTGGLVYSETPFMQQVHGREHDFTRLTHLGHRRLFRNFEEVSSGTCVGTGTALASAYKHFLLSLTNKKIIQELLAIYAIWTSFYLKYLDLLTINNRVTYDAASGFYFLGRKSITPISDKEILKLYRGNL